MVNSQCTLQYLIDIPLLIHFSDFGIKSKEKIPKIFWLFSRKFRFNALINGSKSRLYPIKSPSPLLFWQWFSLIFIKEPIQNQWWPSPHKGPYNRPYIGHAQPLKKTKKKTLIPNSIQFNSSIFFCQYKVQCALKWKREKLYYSISASHLKNAL